MIRLRQLDVFALPALMLVCMALAFILHISVGAKTVPFGEVVRALFAFDPETFDHVIVRDLRMPRAILAVVVGASLSVAGALMQGVTRNPLAEPGLLGLLAGASLAVVLAVGVLGIGGTLWLPLIAAIGALFAAMMVWGIAVAAPGGATKTTLILAGAAVSAFLGAIITGLNLVYDETFENLRVWLTGTLAGRDISVLYWASPWLVLGMVGALAMAREVTTLAMGEDAATGLGVNVARLKVTVLFSVVALTASAVAIAGPMGFVGLVIPHVVRLFVGADYRRIVPYSAVVGASYLLIIDIVARLALAPIEISTGIVTALLGAPLFVWLVMARL